MKKKNGKSVKKIVSNTIILLITALLALVAVRLIIAKTKGEPYFFLNKYSLIWVLTPSMEPAIPARSFILIERTDENGVDVGDVITFRSTDPSIEGSLNTHRIVAVEETASGRRFTTKGDGNAVADSYPAEGANVFGKYISNVPFLTTLGRVFATNAGMILSFVSVLLVAGFSIYNQVMEKKIRKESEENEALVQEKIKAELDKLIASGGVPEGYLSEDKPKEEAKTEKELEMERLIREEVERLKAQNGNGNQS